MPPFQPVPNHPSAQYRTYRDAMQRFWIECQCTRCNAFWKKQCMRPRAWAQHVVRFGHLHAHRPRAGVRP